MSGIYISGISMPKDGTFNIVHIYGDGHVELPLWGKGMQPIGGVTAIYVPDHGRLGDLDAMEDRFCHCFVGDAVGNMPTIIPADK